ncbi:MAG: phosphohistidine phosphatase SixA [Planctomycetes bacterium]|nr:phosphohistidine phosphatase SixA [Planctomycetota bacterium]
MRIYLLRHGIAEDRAASGHDHDRALTEEGWRRLRKAARTWRALVPKPAQVWVSPLRRARETAEVFCAALDAPPARVEPSLTPESGCQTVARLLEAEQIAGVDSIAVIGHEPHLGHLLGLLLTGQRHLPMPLKKGMLVAVETPSIASLLAELRFALSQRAAADCRD